MMGWQQFHTLAKNPPPLPEDQTNAAFRNTSSKHHVLNRRAEIHEENGGLKIGKTGELRENLLNFRPYPP